jgi:hypothetical protein
MSGWKLTTPATNNELLVYPLDQTITIGRAPDNRIQLPGSSVSRYHAVLEPGADGYTVRDLGSTNGTFVNQALVKQPKRLREGDVLRVGNYQLTVGRDRADQSPGGTFVQSPAGHAPPAAPPEKRRSFWRTCLIVTLLGFCGLVVVAAGGYYLYTSGAISRRTVLNAVGLGAGEISITNVTETALTARLTRLDTESGSPEEFNSVRFEALDIAGFGGIPPGRYLLEFSGGREASCSMQIESGDQFNLLVVPEGIAIAKAGYEPDSADELDLATSSLCRQ